MTTRPTGGQALFSNTTGGSNTANGVNALYSNTTGTDNTASGLLALDKTTSGINNTATGSRALQNNTTGTDNTANGYKALFSNTTASDNTANSYRALYSNTTGIENTVTGTEALFSNTTGGSNTATGVGALFSNTTASENTANGFQALFFNTTGTLNTASGFQALYHNTTGSQNTANGWKALTNNTTGTANIAVGYNAGIALTTGYYNIDIGNLGGAGESAIIHIGTQGIQMATFIAGISGATVSGSPVVVNTSGQLGVGPPSSERFKEQIKSMYKASEALLSLRPVTFRYKKNIDPKSLPQFGLVAEEVEKVDPDLVVRDAKGEVFTVRYEAVNAMLLNEFLKEHRKVEQQEATITQLKEDFQAAAAHQQKQIEALSAGLEKVTAQLETSKPAQTVANNQ